MVQVIVLGKQTGIEIMDMQSAKEMVFGGFWMYPGLSEITNVIAQVQVCWSSLYVFNVTLML